MKTKSAVCMIIAVLLFSTCNNFFHDLIPPNGDRIISFTVLGQEGETVINENTIFVNVGKDVDVYSLVPAITVSPKAKFIPLTMDYVQAAFPQVDVAKEAKNLYETDDIYAYVEKLIKETPDFTVPEPLLPIDFAGPVTILVISAQGNIREYTAYVAHDTGEPRLLGIRFTKYDNPEIIGDALCEINEANKTITAAALYPMEMDNLSYKLIPSFDILGDRVEIDDMPVTSGETEVQFNGVMFAPQVKTITVYRGGMSVDYKLTMYFSEDPDSIRSIIDFRFMKLNNPQMSSMFEVGSIINTGDTGTIKVQVFYSGAKPAYLTPFFLTPGTVTVNGVIQTSQISSHDFSSPINYRVVSRNGQYVRTYTVTVDFVSLTEDIPKITTFSFSNVINHDLVKDAAGEISDSAGLIMIDAYYGSSTAPYTLTPTFSAGGIVTVSNSVQLSGASAQDFRNRIKYTVTHPEVPQLTRDYWVQVRFVQEPGAAASITAFEFHPDENANITERLTATISQNNINIYMLQDIGIAVNEMIPRFTSEGTVRVNGEIQYSGISGHIFDAPITYTVVSANGRNTRDYVVTVWDFTEILVGKMGIEMVWIDAGTFQMGSPVGEPNRYTNETQHSVTISQGFYMGRYEVTQGQWEAVMGSSDARLLQVKGSSYGVGDDHPMYYVSWYDIMVFCNKLSILEGLTPAYRISGKTNPDEWGSIPTSWDASSPWNSVEVVSNSNGYRLPTEAQWEYACRAGTTTPFGIGDGTKLTHDMANFYIYYPYDTAQGGQYYDPAGTGYLGRTTEVGSYIPNAWGLFDMHGNVWEWCWDWYASDYTTIPNYQTDPAGASSGSGRIERGGYWNDAASYARSAYRSYYSPHFRNSRIGFRVLRP